MNGMCRRNVKGKNGERGSVLAVSTFGMLAFLLATGLCVDISHFYLVKTELQNAADAAALAGATALNADDGGITRATDLAIRAMNSYEFNHKGTALTRTNVTFAVNLDGAYMNETAAKAKAAKIRFVKVKIPPKSVPVSFAAMVLGNTFDLDAEATAGMSVSLNTFCDWIPLSVIDDNVAVIKAPNLYTIRRPPGGAISPGNYQILAVDGPGASDDRIGLGGGVKNCVGAGSSVSTKPGVSAGAVRQGINTRFGVYGGGLDPVDYPPDQNVKEGITYQDYLNTKEAAEKGVAQDPNLFQAPTRGTPQWGRRVVVIPIVKISEFDGGRDRVTIHHFGAFFLQTGVDNGNGGDIKAEYIGKRVVIGRGGYDPTGGPVTPELSIPVLYR